MFQLQLEKNTHVSEKSMEENIIAREASGSEKGKRSVFVMIVVHFRN